MRVATDIVSIAHFKTHASRLLREMRSHGGPFIITQSGKAAAVVMTPNEFDALEERARVLTRIHAGLQSARTGTFSPSEVRSRAKARIRSRRGAR